jgi:hypothetical protein
MANLLPPNSIGFVHNPNLVLPVYIQTEVVRVQDVQGNVWSFRRPRPLSVLAGASIVLQSDRDLLARFVFVTVKSKKQRLVRVCVK